MCCIHRYTSFILMYPRLYLYVVSTGDVSNPHKNCALHRNKKLVEFYYFSNWKRSLGGDGKSVWLQLNYKNVSVVFGGPTWTQYPPGPRLLKVDACKGCCTTTSQFSGNKSRHLNNKSLVLDQVTRLSPRLFRPRLAALTAFSSW